MFGTWSAFGIGLLSLFAFILWYLSPSYAADEPPPLPHTLPVLGHALSFAKDRRTLFDKADEKNNHQPFSFLIAGRKHYIFSKPSEYAAVYKNSSTLDARNFVRMLMIKWFGYSEKEATKLGQMKAEFHEINSTFLLREENNRTTAIKYFGELETRLRILDGEIDQSKAKSLTKAGLQLVEDVQGAASTIAYFGKKPLETNPDVISDLALFNRYGFWPLLFGVPRFIYPRPHEARDRIMAAFRSLVETMGSRDDVSPYIRNRSKLVRETFGDKILVSDMFSIWFGLNSNSIPNAYCALLNMITIPGLVSSIRDELSAAGYSTLQPHEYITIIPSRVPLLKSFYFESLRVHINATNFREVLQPTTLTCDDRTYRLAPGGVVTLCGTLLHGNPAIHPNPTDFRPRRFLDRDLGGDGENAAKTTKPFGGGTSYCPGRVFAEKQIIGFLAALCTRYDMRVVSDGFEIPRNSDLDYVAACPPVMIEIRKRET